MSLTWGTHYNKLAKETKVVFWEDASRESLGKNSEADAWDLVEDLCGSTFKYKNRNLRGIYSLKRQERVKLFVLLIMVVIITMSGCTNDKGTMEEVPDVIDVVLKDKDNAEIVTDNGWLELQPITRINVQFEGEVDYIFLYLTPTGTETFAQRELIGVMSAYDNDSTGEKGFGAESTTAEYIWTVPDESIMGHLGVELISGTVARYESDLVNVMNDKGID